MQFDFFFFFLRGGGLLIEQFYTIHSEHSNNYCFLIALYFQSHSEYAIYYSCCKYNKHKLIYNNLIILMIVINSHNFTGIGIELIKMVLF